MDGARLRLAELEAASTGAQDVARLDGIALHEEFAVMQEVVIHQAGSDHGDDDPVVADEAAAGGFGEGELVRDGAVDFRRIHGIDEPGVALSVALAEVVMARGGGEEEPLPDGEIPVAEGKAEVDAFAPGGLVGFVEDREVEGRARLHARGDDVRRLVGGEDEPHPGVARAEKLAHPRAVGGDGEIEVAGAQDDFVASGLHGGVGADAQMRQRGP